MNANVKRERKGRRERASRTPLPDHDRHPGGNPNTTEVGSRHPSQAASLLAKLCVANPVSSSERRGGVGTLKLNLLPFREGNGPGTPHEPTTTRANEARATRIHVNGNEKRQSEQMRMQRDRVSAISTIYAVLLAARICVQWTTDNGSRANGSRDRGSPK